MDSPVEILCPVKDCSQVVDLTLKSSDGKLIGAHRENMGRFSDGFPHATAVINDKNEIVPLAEPAQILELLLEFMHPHRLPSCDKLDIETVLSLARAAEKYLVYFAMGTCNTWMSQGPLHKGHPLHVLLYAVNHDYPELADVVAPLTVTLRHQAAWEIFREDFALFSKWTLFREKYEDITRFRKSKISDSVIMPPSLPVFSSFKMH
ncbi:hypothetical protein C8J56DRAFT_837859 [Mycena floridula]|nr:hypothetical protein C8J56DRAFT_837859 [Mycena floridula]